MNIQEYISSGIVESYVLGLATDEEKVEFERMCAAHPEVKAGQDAFEQKLEALAIQNAISPDRELKDRIFSEIDLAGERPNHSTLGTELFPNSREQDDAEVDAPVIGAGWRYFAVAAVILLIGSIWMNLYFFRKFKDSNKRYNALLAQQSELAGNNQTLQARLAEKENTVFMMKDTGMLVIKMPGKNVPTSPDPSSLATIYWDKRTKDVYLMVNQMPHPSVDKQYQLWAIVNGKPVNAGVFDITDPYSRVKMKNIRDAQAFAVTLEKKGGSQQPSRHAMYVMGRVS